MNLQQLEDVVIQCANRLNIPVPSGSGSGSSTTPQGTTAPRPGVYFRRNSYLPPNPTKRQNVRLRLEIVFADGTTQDLDAWTRDVNSRRSVPAYRNYTLVRYADTVNGALKRVTHKRRWEVGA